MRAIVGEGVEAMGIIEALLILAMAALDLAVVPGGVRTDQLVADAQFGGGGLEERGKITPGGGETVGELETVVGLYAFSPPGRPVWRTCAQRF